jgi:hypothetical protein
MPAAAICVSTTDLRSACSSVSRCGEWGAGGEREPPVTANSWLKSSVFMLRASLLLRPPPPPLLRCIPTMQCAPLEVPSIVIMFEWNRR